MIEFYKIDPGCAVFPRSSSCKGSLAKSRSLLKETLFAIKTCKANHQSRLPVLKETWSSIPDHIIFVSNFEDPEFGPIVLPGASKNTAFGHCHKTQSILKYFNSHAKKENWKWLVIVDDDTILSVAKLMDLLQCYLGYDNDKPLLALGEKWGFRVSMAKGRKGHDYLAGKYASMFCLSYLFFGVARSLSTIS